MSAQGLQLINRLNSVNARAMGIVTDVARLNNSLKATNTKVNTLGNSLDNLRSGFNSLGERVNSAVRTANGAKVQVDSLGRTVIDTQNRLGSLGNKVVNIDQKTNGLLTRFQQLNSSVNSVLSKLAPLFGLLNFVGAIAGLVALYGMIKTVFPRLDGHDRELDNLRQATSDNISLIGKTKAQLQSEIQAVDQKQARINDSQSDQLRTQSRAIDNLAAQNQATQNTANNANTVANQALGIGKKALSTSGTALNIALQVSAVVGSVAIVANGAKALANLALSRSLIPGPPGPRGAKGDRGPQGDRGLRGFQGLKGLPGARGLRGLQGLRGQQGQQGLRGLQGLPGLMGLPGPSGAPGAQGIKGDRGLQGATGPQGLRGLVGARGPQGTPGTAGATGSQGIQGIQGPAGAPGKDATMDAETRARLIRIETGVNLNNTQSSLINTKLGDQLTGGLSGKLTRMSKWLQLDRVWNILTYAAVLHNAWMLSSSFSQTLLSATSNLLAAVGIDDDEGNPLDIGSLIGKKVEETAESIFGKEKVDFWQAQYKKYVRVYQATANLLGSLASIGYSILSVLEIIGSRISRIGNALRRFGVVGDRAYAAMNENDLFQNPFFNRVTRMEEAASTIDIVASEVVSVRQTATDLKTQKKTLDDAVKAATTKTAKAEASEEGKIPITTVLDEDVP